MANPFPFVSGAVLTAAQLNGIAEAGTSFTPTWSNYTRGNGTTVAKYIRINKFLYVYVTETLGTTSSVTGSISLTLPIAASVQQSLFGVAIFEDTGAATIQAMVYPTGTTSSTIFALNTAGTYGGVATATSATVPHTWAATDRIIVNMVYEVA